MKQEVIVFHNQSPCNPPKIQFSIFLFNENPCQILIEAYLTSLVFHVVRVLGFFVCFLRVLLTFWGHILGWPGPKAPAPAGPTEPCHPVTIASALTQGCELRV